MKKYKRPDVLPTRTYKEDFACAADELHSVFLRLSDDKEEIETLVEALITIGKAGRCTDCLLTTVSRLITLALQHRIPRQDIVRVLIGVKCPAAVVGHPDSCVDWIGKTISQHEE